MTTPVHILCRELNRLDNDSDRLQMLVTLKSRLNHLQLNADTFYVLFSIFNDENYRLQAIHQLLPFIHTLITLDSFKKLLELFNNNQYRFNLIKTLKNYEPLKTNNEIYESLNNEYRQYFHMKTIQSQKSLNNSEIQSIQMDDSKQTESTNPITTSSNASKVLSSTSGVFEKAKQFVCRVFGGSSSSLNQDLSNKRIIDEDNTEPKRFHSLIENGNREQFEPTTLLLSRSPSYTSILTKSPPPSPITMTEQPIVRQSSMLFNIDESSVPIQSMMVTQIHSILDNIDSVLDKIEAQTNSVSRRAVLNENSSSNTTQLSNDRTDEISHRSLQQNTDQITQTSFNMIEQHLNMNDGSGDTTSAYIDLLDLAEDSSSIVSSESSDEIIFL